MLARIVDELARREGPRILAGLIGRLGGDFDLAEERCRKPSRARSKLAGSGIPDRPGAWITTCARVRDRRAAAVAPAVATPSDPRTACGADDPR
jgi:RNA polymerase sigma-70 factor (ECF subfamily)